MQHLEHLRLVLLGRRSTRSTSGSFCAAGATLGAPSLKSAAVRRRVMRLGTASFCVAGAALGAPQARFAWQAQHSEHLRLVLRGMRSTWSTFIEVGGNYAFRRGVVLRGRPALGAPQARFVWQAQHLEHLRLVLRGRRNTRSTSGSFCVAGAALGAPQARFAWQVQHLEHGRCSTRSISVAYCGAFL